MPCGYTANQKRILASEELETVVACKIPFPVAAGGEQLLTDSGFVFTYDGDVYRPGNILVSATPPDKTKPRSLLQFILNDDEAVWRKRFDVAGNELPITFRALVVNDPNDIFPVVTFKGVVDDYDSATQENGAPVLVCQATSLFIKLDDQPTNSTSKSFQQDFATAVGNSPDTSMDSAHVAFRAVRHKAAS